MDQRRVHLTKSEAHELRMTLCGIETGHAPGPFQWALRCAVFGVPIDHQFKNERMRKVENDMHTDRLVFLDSTHYYQLTNAAQQIVRADKMITEYLMSEESE